MHYVDKISKIAEALSGAGKAAVDDGREDDGWWRLRGRRGIAGFGAVEDNVKRGAVGAASCRSISAKQ